MADDLPTQIKKLKLRHPDWFKGHAVKEDDPVPKKPASGPSAPVVAVPQKAYWDHDDADRNDV